MAIPDYVHPFRLLVACFGLDPRKPLPRVQVILQWVGALVELPPITIIQFIAALRERFAPLGRRLANPSEVLLDLPTLPEEFSSDLKEAIDRFSSAMVDGSLDTLIRRLEGSLQVDTETFLRLVDFSFGRLQSACYRRRPRPPILTELDRFCDALIAAAPEAFHVAHRALYEETVTPDALATIQRQQASLRPLHHLLQSERHDKRRQPHPALIDRLRAWADATESTIYDVVKFVYALRNDPVGEAACSGDQPVERAHLLGLAADWCRDNAVSFPFRPDLYTIQNCIFRGHYTVSSLEVSFNDARGQPLAALNLNEVAQTIENDTLFASHFAAALPFTEFRHRNCLGMFDTAWSRAKSCIPDLEIKVIDIDSIWPNRAFAERRHNFKVRTFGAPRNADGEPATSAAADPLASPPADVQAGATASRPNHAHGPILEGPLLEDLEQLLRSLFPANDDFSQFLYYQNNGAAIVAALPSTSVPKAKWTHEAVRRLNAEGRLDAQFFDKLARAYARRASEINVMKQRLGLEASRDFESLGHVLVFQGQFARQTTIISPREVQAALSPAAPVISPFRIDQVSIDLRRVATWITTRSSLHGKLKHFLDTQVRPSEHPHVSVFALGPTPWLVALGNDLGDTVPTSVYGRHRNPQTWAWQTDRWPGTELRVEKRLDGSARPAVALLLSISAQISYDQVETILPEWRRAFYELSIEDPRPDAIRTLSQWTELSSRFPAILGEILGCTGGSSPIHIFAAAPAHVLVALGQSFPRRAAPGIYVHDYDGKRGFGPGLPIIEI